MTLHAASREALSLAETRLDEVLGDAGTDPSAVGEELLSVVDLLTKEVGLRRAVADGSSDPEARKRLVRTLLEGKVSEPALNALDAVVGNRWSNPRELVDGLESIGISALLISAEKSGKLDAVEDELFRVARIVEGEPGLEQALSDMSSPVEAKRRLARNLFADKVDPVTEVLVEQAVVRPRGRSVAGGVDTLVKLAAARRERSVAYVRSASELTTEQRDKLAADLGRIYGRAIALHVQLDNRIGAGLVVRVGDEVIDGSAAGRLDALRRQLAG
ncbi:F0F1 ATP synthase subunit delta [Prauserella marina]|uniref:ATP synthase subunit delta n=1 Tax=Prauserella marina TaxID=530584 RepID=A0A222VV81_9PSEU|nr:F0F1 ATP synthase subunit delta [Prauserella marina]ASR37800.1 F0F1 ATP synthase subunit delta [Prauserella marina]PWV75757.1 ATP synthase F1 subcomplex delta subunit [Prauserella marina]SDD26947.1 F-type H+-transporting ATPase subunit delta [Prauserella marina]